MELRSRSRSKTPFQQKNEDDDDTDQYNGSFNNRIVTRSRKSTNTINASEHYITSSSSSTMSVKNARKSYKTSDYSSEEGEFDLKHITENQRNQIIEDAKAAANGNKKRISALDLYRKAGRYWDKYPKTDWTYSPHSKDRVEIAPGVVQMPNMSRPTIHSYDSSTNTDLTFNQYSRYNNNNSSRQYNENWLIRCVNYIKYLFLSSTTTSNTVTSTTNRTTIKTTNIDENDFIIRKSTTKRSFISYITTIFLTFFSIFYYFYYIQNTLIVWFGKKLHHFTSRLMLFDTWLLMKRRRNNGSKINRLIILCLLPLIIFAGLHIIWANGISLAPFCHPNCGRLIANYYHSFIKTTTNIFN